VRLTHPQRVLLRDPLITKEDLAAFYRSIAHFILPGLVNRPLMLLRCPQGDRGECFFQKHISRGFPPAVRQIDDRASGQRWVYIDGLEGLIGLVQMNALEYHVWGATVSNLDRPDRVVIDLDPATGVPWARVVAGALELRARLTALKLCSFVRTSGGKGLHVVIPVRPATDWETARGFARALAEGVARDSPERYVAVAAKAQRSGKIFLDYLRNGRGATAVCSYSLRNRPGAPLATPLRWEELSRVRTPDQFRFANIQRRLARLVTDPWEEIDRVAQRLPQLRA
jgi:bifunctional non-homologous end joining protein LigD